MSEELIRRLWQRYEDSVEAAGLDRERSSPRDEITLPNRDILFSVAALRIRALQSAFTTARDDALEEAAKVAIRRRKEAMRSSHPESPIREDEAEEICVLIRALKSETKL